ncbi:MAG: hypothetical protein AAF631_07605 [Pseudomonadota bacterium]
MGRLQQTKRRSDRPAVARLGEADTVAAALAPRFRQVFARLLRGPWPGLAPQATALIAQANPTV